MIEYSKDKFEERLNRVLDAEGFVSFSRTDIPNDYVPVCAVISSREGRTVEEWSSSIRKELSAIEEVQSLNAITNLSVDRKFRMRDLSVITEALSGITIVQRSMYFNDSYDEMEMTLSVFLFSRGNE